MMATLQFYEIDCAYIDYLSKTDKRVPLVDYSAVSAHDKFLCGIVLSVNEHDYFAPISSFRTPQRTNILIKNEKDRAIASIRFSFMIPVPKDVLKLKDISAEPSEKYRRLLNWELSYCNKHIKAILSRARFVHNAVTVKKDPLMVKNCCDFKALESACTQYINQRKTAKDKSQPPSEKPSVIDEIRADRINRTRQSEENTVVKGEFPNKEKSNNQPEL